REPPGIQRTAAGAPVESVRTRKCLLRVESISVYRPDVSAGISALKVVPHVGQREVCLIAAPSIGPCIEAKNVRREIRDAAGHALRAIVGVFLARVDERVEHGVSAVVIVDAGPGDKIKLLLQELALRAP